MKKDGLYKKLLDTAVIPVLLLGVVVTFFCYFRFTDTIYQEAGNNMRNVAELIDIAYNSKYPGDYELVNASGDTYDLHKGGVDITRDYSIVDDYAAATGTQISLLYKDMRIHTTFIGSKGSRLAGISTNAETSDKVLTQRQEVFYRNITILDEKYLVLYVPVLNSDDTVTGMIEIAKSQASLNKSVIHAVWPILVLLIFGVALAAWISYRSTKNITDDIKTLQQFLNKVAGGSLSVDLDTRLIKRKDEIGDISKSSIAMQKSIRTFVGTDPLTGLNNRRYVLEALEKIQERSATTGMPFSLAIGDIDFFKKVNDTYGHNAGDDVLKAVAGILKDEMVGKGFAARWGGEEFILVFDKGDVAGSTGYMNAILDRIRSTTVESEGFSINITMTMGAVDGSDDTIENIVSVADEKLYYGKEHGRNQLVT